MRVSAHAAIHHRHCMCYTDDRGVDATYPQRTVRYSVVRVCPWRPVSPVSYLSVTLIERAGRMPIQSNGFTVEWSLALVVWWLQCAGEEEVHFIRLISISI